MVNGTLSGTKLTAKNVNINRKIIMGEWNILLDQDSKVLHFTYKNIQQFQIVREDSITITTPYTPANDSMIFSNIVSGITAPGAPRNLQVTSKDGDDISISYVIPSYNGGAAISDYKIVLTPGTKWSNSYSTTDANTQTINNGTTTTRTISSLEPGNRYSIAVSAKNASSSYGSAITINDSTLLFGCTNDSTINYNPEATNQSTSITCINALSNNTSIGTPHSSLTIARAHLETGAPSTNILNNLMPATHQGALATIDFANINSAGDPWIMLKRSDVNNTDVDFKSIASGGSGSSSYVQFNLRDTGSTTTTIFLYIVHPRTKNTYVWSFQDSLSGNGLTGNAYQPNVNTNNWQWVKYITGTASN